MNYKRRDFLKTAGLAGAGLMMAPWLSSCKGTQALSKASRNFGLQLYTLRDVLPSDPAGVLKQVASFGYKQIESYEGAKGMFWGMKNTEFKKLMDDLGMKIVASHCNINENFERKAAEAAAIGMNYLICPWLGPQKTIEDYKRAAAKFNQLGEVCRKNGMRFAYHNHDYSFLPVEGQLPQDVMMQQTDAALVDYEMDIYWVATAGQDPEDWFDKYPNRFRLCHIKDRRKGATQSDRDASVILGTGSLDWKDILKKAGARGMEYFIVEQEAYANTTPIDATRANAAYMKSL
jgi:sugar phosphate isomerase/epimerase